ncbi:hypothetical protein BJY26_003421 [Spelaeicoccus albus]|uniref:Uncharacterized protein n=1 Tax=Spelaeicoccus albus TaxID=1280376 RepID=A0A7Z0D593_9MICO|nr:hypothetical protein [Spelaeicoccus albus]
MRLTFLKSGIPINQNLPDARLRPALVGEKRCRTVDCGRNDLERGRARRSGIDAVEERLDELLLTVKQHFALVAEVPKERALGQADGLGDFRRRRLLEPASGEQFERCRLKTLFRARFPTHHSFQHTVMTVTVIRCTVMSVTDNSH